ncbi:LytTR family transcriptional regulator DNA-binding domain-containing protein [Brevibacillus brevis]|uniref:LytTR family transcriptional regulator DNA-binding domain-containing protein n=1 Tax=Brevibacillus brevis TaxID=1393 RepID=UPI00165D3BBA|nr:LytTR family transcriptional regulator DNA-binding domain-containing protein [Brevibacillus brevis]
MIMFSGVNQETKEIEEFSIEEVYYVDLFKPKTTAKNGILQYHTRRGTFLGLVTLEDIAWYWRDFGFYALDSVNVINANNIVCIKEDTFSATAIFDDGSTTSVSKKRLHLIEHLNIPRKCPS